MILKVWAYNAYITFVFRVEERAMKKEDLYLPATYGATSLVRGSMVCKGARSMMEYLPAGHGTHGQSIKRDCSTAVEMRSQWRRDERGNAREPTYTRGALRGGGQRAPTF